MAGTFALLGATGLVGGQILQFLLKSPTPTKIITLTRRDTGKTSTDHTLVPVIEKDTEKWASLWTEACKASDSPPIALASLGTTRAAAGGLEQQYKIDHDLNLEIAKAAKDAGVKVFVLISSTGASSTSMFPYTKMKGQIEDDIEKCGFEKYIVLRPGMLLGSRTESRLLESVITGVAKGLGSISGGALSNSWAQEADWVARAAVRAALDDKITGKKILEQKEIVHLGKEENW